MTGGTDSRQAEDSGLIRPAKGMPFPPVMERTAYETDELPIV